jgi:bifunctional UDP-N-acetylglucosamine pyrophosphorylase/glucosamine-1-phosphate N-acetyltransferase
VGTDNSQGEVYLTDIVAIAAGQGVRVEKWCHPQAIDVLGVNSRVELAQAQAALQQRRNRELMLAGVTFEAPATTLVGPDCTIGGDTVLHGGVRIEGGAVVGRACRIEANCVLHGCRLDDGVTIGANSVLHGGEFPAGSIVPPLTARSAT